MEAFLRPTTPPRPFRSTRSGIYEAWNYSITPQSRDNGPNLTKLIASIRRSGRGGIIHFEPAPYKFRTAVTDLNAGLTSSAVDIVGCGRGLTSFLADGPLLTSGNMFTPGRYFRVHGVTMSATAVRSAGDYIKVTGDMLVGDIPSKKFMGVEFFECAMENGFNGVELVDGPGSLGVCGFSWDGGSLAHCRGFAPGGTLFIVNTPNGTVNRFANTIHSETNGVAAGSRPFATMRVQGAADLRCENIENVYCQNGLIIDPGATGRAATLFFQNCIWGQCTSDTIRIEPTAGADVHAIVFNGGYADTVTGFTIKGSAAKGISISDMTFLGCATGGLILDGCSKVTATNIMVDGGNLFGLYAKNNASQFYFQGICNNAFANNGTGVRIDAGSTDYEVHLAGATANCTTPSLITPAPAANRITTVF